MARASGPVGQQLRSNEVAHNELAQHLLWRSHQGQEIDYLEELNGGLRGDEIKWREKRMKVPSAFSTA